MHGENPTHTRHRMVYSSVLVTLVSRCRSRSGRVEEMPIVGVLRRVWIPPVILAVIGFGGVTVSLVRIVFASAQQPAGEGSHADQIFSAGLSAYAHCLGKSA